MRHKSCPLLRRTSRTLEHTKDMKHSLTIPVLSTSLRPLCRSLRGRDKDPTYSLKAFCNFLCTETQWKSTIKAQILPLLTKHDLQPDTILFNTDEMPSLYVVISGTIVTSENQVYSRGTLLGQESWLFQEKSKYTATSESSATVYMLPWDSYEKLIALATRESLLWQAMALNRLISADAAWAHVSRNALWKHRQSSVDTNEYSVYMLLFGSFLSSNIRIDTSSIIVTSHLEPIGPCAWIQLTRNDVDIFLGHDTALGYLSSHDLKTQYSPESFQVIETIGFGSFGKVYLTKHEPSGQLVALKTIPKINLPSVKLALQVIREREALKAVQHPFIARYIASFQDEENLYIATEFIQGGELWHRIYGNRDSRLDESTVAFYGANIALALRAMHKQNILYRDLKLENILLDRRGYLKLIDMGFAKDIGPLQNSNEGIGGDTRTRTLCGTPEYMAPEVIAGKGYGALGAVLYELATGISLYARPDNNQTRIMTRIAASRIQGHPLHPAFHSLSSNFRLFILGLLECDPSKRLGCTKEGFDTILNHPLYATMNWKALEAQELEPPYIPSVQGPQDTQHFHFEEFMDDYDDVYDCGDINFSRIDAVLKDF
ncbi:cAMP-dependent protein kinase catalytic subunit alpha-like isoform 1 [Thraustotheca clavata]|uniref:cAMP-dependent protein kinase catalytic subunit alpha-like isoform 1 n=1 Tax=Thraustotheca clavata TaxID=74557 RepID=A0A1W0AA06_9STRA|nr:cAMP-dependent protein kinase catalytic subunit alpha-like isoform 1 [Thraustotheca clavata]